MFTKEFWFSQIFAVVGLVLLTISMLQKNRVKILWWNLFAVIAIFISTVFLFHESAIILSGASTLRAIHTLTFAYIRRKVRKWIFWTANLTTAAIIIGLDIYFWQDIYSLINLFVGIGLIVSFSQQSTSRLRALIIPTRLTATVYYLLLLVPIHAVIEIAACIGAIISVIRFDCNKRERLKR